MTTAKVVNGYTLGYVRLARGEHVSFILGDRGEYLCELSMADDGTPSVLVSDKRIVQVIYELTGDD